MEQRSVVSKRMDMKLKPLHLRSNITFPQCRHIINLFVKGLSVEKIVGKTGLHPDRVIQILSLTRAMMLEENAPRVHAAFPAS